MIIRMAKTNGKNPEKESQDPKGKAKKISDEKRKKNFNKFGWYLAWLGFFSLVGSSLFKLIKNMEQPEKNDYYK